MIKVRSMLFLLVAVGDAFVPKPTTGRTKLACLASAAKGNDLRAPPRASLVGFMSESDRERLNNALRATGYNVVQPDSHSDWPTSYEYSLDRATGMLKLVRSPSSEDDTTTIEAPRWIPLVRSMENVLIENGWSFLDPDENEQLSPFDVDAANLEGLYRPKWGTGEFDLLPPDTTSDLGFALQRLSSEDVERIAKALQGEWSRSVLLEGDTDPPGLKCTQNGVSFAGSVSQDAIPQGIFVCSIGGLPLFSSTDLAVSTASSGWLSFTRPLSDEHINLVHPEPDSPDQRIEVICAKSGCHLGHYFGKGNGYCINASALDFVKRGDDKVTTNDEVLLPISWRAMEELKGTSRSIGLLADTLKEQVNPEIVILGAGCFWHIEFALRRLPGVIETKVGYAGGTTKSPTYEDVCKKATGHAEVVKVTFDPSTLNLRILMDCYLALHDPTKVRAHGKHAASVGQYRSCVFCTTQCQKAGVDAALQACRKQLQKELITEVSLVEGSIDSFFWVAEDRHQRHDEMRNLDADVSTISAPDWLGLYGRRADTVIGGAETLSSLTAT